MNPLRVVQTVRSAPVARERLEVLLEYERRSIKQSDPIALLREDILTVVALYPAIAPYRVEVKVDRGSVVSRLAVDIEVPSQPRV
jgi:cell division topological specificity factor